MILVITTIGLCSISSAKISLTPALSIREQYNDNLFLSEVDKEGDFITTVIPSISLNYVPSRYLDASLNYGLNFRFYSRHSELNDSRLSDTQQVDFQSRARPFDRFFIDVFDLYRRVPVDVRDVAAPDNDFRNMTESNLLGISPYIVVPLTSTLSSRIGYEYSNRWYKTDDGNDAETHAAYGSLTKRFPFGLDLAIKYGYSTYLPEMTSDVNAHLIFGTAYYQVASNLIVWGGGGLVSLDFSDIANDKMELWNGGVEYRIKSLGDTVLRASYEVSIPDAEPAGLNMASKASFFRYTDSEPKLPERSEIEHMASNFFEEKSTVTTGLTEEKRFDLEIIAKKKPKH